MRARLAFSLVEVALALLVAALVVTSALVLFPSGVRAQQFARFQVLAAMKAEEMMDTFASSPNDNTGLDSEAFQPWDVPVGYRVLAPDIEARLASPPYGIMPLPLAIARRLDSDGDEIQRVLDDGAYVYYAQAAPVGQLRDDVIRQLMDASPRELQQLVFTVVGPPQQNALFSFPWKAWPYYAHYPSPPLHGAFLSGQYEAPNITGFVWPTRDENALFEGAKPAIAPTGATGFDDDMSVVFEYHEDDVAYGFKPYAYDCGAAAPTKDQAKRYVQAALWYCLKKNLPNTYYAPANPATPLTDFSGSTVPRWQQVNALRFLAHAASCMTVWLDVNQLGGQPSAAGSGYTIPAQTLKGIALPDLELTHDRIVFWHESCLNLAMKYAAEDPYDWGAPRPIQRALMTDYPLLQWDLFSPPLTGTLFDKDEGLGTVPAAQWRPVSAKPITNLGVSWTFPDRAVGPADYSAPNGAQIWGDANHFTLTKPFAPAERCRELVFWAVDWQGYEDCETCASAPVDASRFQIAGPLKGQTFQQRMGWNDWWEMHLRDSRNPEMYVLFTDPAVASLGNGASVAGKVMGYDTWPDRDDAHLFSGLYGADRNGNGVLDKGPIPKSTRLRATQVARYCVYDPRVPAVLR